MILLRKKKMARNLFPNLLQKIFEFLLRKSSSFALTHSVCVCLCVCVCVCVCITGAYPATARGGGGGGSGRAVPRCRHIGCVVSHGAAAVSCCVRVISTCVTCVTCAGRATMTRRGGEGGGRGGEGGPSESVPRHVP